MTIFGLKSPTPPKCAPSHLDNLKSICINWSLRLNLLHTAIPPELCPRNDPVAWPPALTAALRQLSELTPGRMDRAHSLLKTYFYARIQCTPCQSPQRAGYSILEVVDVQDAIRSLQLLNRGQEVEGGVRRRSSADVKRKLDVQERPGTKRKFSIRDEWWQHQGDASRRPSLSEASDSLSDVSSASPHPRLASIPGIFSPSRKSHVPLPPPQPFRGSYLFGRSRPLASIPTLNISSPGPKVLAVSTPAKTARSPIWNLINFPATPTPRKTQTPARLPPVTSLFSAFGDVDETKHEESEPKRTKEQELKQFELEEAQAALEVARQKHLVATRRAAMARLELRKDEGLPVRPKSAEK